MSKTSNTKQITEIAIDEAWNNARFFIDHCPPVLRLQPGAEIQYFDGMFRRHT